MSDQLYLQGFELNEINDDDAPVLLRRLTDRACNRGRESDAGIRQFPRLQSKNHTWPVRIYTLGRFSLLINEEPVEFGRKFPRKPLEFLKTLIALGGREVSMTNMSSALWPDADGDTAKRSFDTTLHRLRKILVDDRVLVLRDGKVTLDPQYCWVDLWAFERTLGNVQRVRSQDLSGRDAIVLDSLSSSLLCLYQDHFLSREDATSWSVSIRERLRSKFIHTLIDVGHYWESHGFWDKALMCYQKGLEVDDLVEVFYQRLMACYLETHRISEGMSVYRRCREILSIVLGLQPEAETERLYQMLKNSRVERRSA